MSNASLARLAGLTYLILIVTGIFGLVYVPNQFIDWSDASQTAANITANPFLFKLGVVSEIACFVCFIILPLLLHRLLSFAGPFWSWLMLAFSLISIPVSLANSVKHMDALLLLENHGYLTGFNTETLHAQLMLSIASYNNASTLSFIFWGAWLAPLGILVFKSKILPKVLGVLLVIGSVSYLAEFILKFLFSVESVPSFVGIPNAIAEFGLCLWLLIFGAKSTQSTTMPSNVPAR